MNPKYKRLPWKTRAFLGTFVSSLTARFSLREAGRFLSAANAADAQFI
jgi:sugar/nucleoside kinase (ribokinase family)